MATPIPPGFQDEPLKLAVIRYYMREAGGYDRWSIFIHNSERGLGLEYQIQDNGGKYMEYAAPTEHTKPANIPFSMFVIRSLADDQAAIVQEVAEREPRILSADGANRATQRWTFSIITELMRKGIVQPSDVEEIESMMATRLNHSSGQG